MIRIAQFTLTQMIHEARVSAIYRGHRNEDLLPVVVKLLKDEYPALRDIATLRHEYSIMACLEGEGFLKAYSLEKVGKQLALVMADDGGMPLGQFLNRNLDVSTALHIGIALAGMLESLHSRRVIHLDIKPDNILFNPKTGAVNLIDFGSATRVPQDTQRALNGSVLEGTLAYISPEQTGRMNRAIDHRADFYSLGVTLYQILTGTLPFATAEPMEMVYKHIAQLPVPPRDVARAIPEILSQITLKLLAKNAEDRYQHARGLRADLEECQRQWDEGASIANFSLGQSDFSADFSIPQKLYGREAELAHLMAAWDRATRGAKECLLVSGYAGIGKSALVNEIYKAIASRRAGYFATGKFEQLGRPVPYAAVAQALRELVRQLLTEPQAAVARWKAKLERVLDANAGLLVDFIPELSLLLGPQASVPATGPVESKARFALALQNLLCAVTEEQPVGIFLDDLQWADQASLKLLETLLSDPSSRYLLVVGAYRDNEITATHPLAFTLGVLEKRRVLVTSMTLSPLSLESVHQLATDALRCDPKPALSLAELVFAKTLGNPFFVKRLLLTFWKDGLLSLDMQTGAFTWNLEQIRDADIADNVVDLTLQKMKALEPVTRRVLALAACVGHQFDLSTLAIIDEESPHRTAGHLMEAVEEGLVLAMNDDFRFFQFSSHQASMGWGPDVPDLDSGLDVTFRFLHDRVQQAAYALIEEGRRQQTHLCIGRLILAKSGVESIDTKLLEIVNHMNIGAALITEPSERLQLARLNFTAGKRAQAAAAHKAAVGYLAKGVALLSSECWDHDFELSFGLHLALAECEYLSGGFEEAESLFERLLSRAPSRLERAKTQMIRLRLYMTQNRIHEGLALGRSILGSFGVELPERAEELTAALRQEFAEMQMRLAERSFTDLVHAAEMTDADQRAIMRVLTNLIPPTYQTSADLYRLVIAKLVNTTLKYGRSELTAAAYVLGAWTFREAMGQDAYELGNVGLDLHERSPNVEVSSMLYLCYGQNLCFFAPLRTAVEYTRRAIHAGLESGDLLWCSFSCFHTFVRVYASGEELRTVAKEIETLYAIVRRCNDGPAMLFLTIGKQVIANLTGATRNRFSLSDDSCVEEELVNKLEGGRYALYIPGFYYAEKLRLSFLYEDYAKALELTAKEDFVIDGAPNHQTPIHMMFFTALTYAAVYEAASPIEQANYALEIDRHLAKFEVLAKYGHENYQHKHLLLLAEQARITGRPLEAMELYDKAIDGARQHEFVHDEALANELCAKFYSSLGRTKTARLYLQAAHYGYLCWGAKAKADALAEMHPDLFPAYAFSGSTALGLSSPSSATTSTTTGRLAAGLLDVTAVVKAAQAISSELVLENVVSRLLRIVLENAGAQRGALLLARNGVLTLEAYASSGVDAIRLAPSTPLEDVVDLPQSILQFVARTRELVLLVDAASDSRFESDPYVAAARPASVLCLALVQKGRLTGVLYLENSVVRGAFTQDRVQICGLLSSQAAVAIENALLYEQVQSGSRMLEQANLGMQQEIEERKAVERELREHRDQLDQLVAVRTAALNAAKTQAEVASEAKSAFLANMSHELRSPLNAILGFASILKDDEGIGTSQRQHLEIIENSGRHLQMLIEDVLDLAKIEAGRIELSSEPVDLREFLRLLTDIIQVAASDKGLKFISELDADLPRSASFDAKRLRQVLLNLLGNSVKFSAQGFVGLRVRTLARSSNQARLLFEVFDSGVGIDAADLDCIFEPFEQVGDASSRARGTGLGLAISRRIVRAMNSDVSVTSHPGKGSTFGFALDLPLADIKTEVALPQPTAVGYAGPRKTVLIVDDVSDNRTLLAAFFTRLGFIALQAASGQELLDLAQSDRPDLILTDVVMPGVDGLQAIRMLRGLPEFGDVPIIAVSANASNADRAESLAAGAHAFLTKPIDLDLLSRELTRCMQLEWTMNSPEDACTPAAELVAPPQDEIEILYRLARIGNMGALRARADHVSTLDAQYQPFANRLRTLANQYASKAIVDLIAVHRHP